MNQRFVYLLAMVNALTFSAWAQDTNDLKTTIGVFEAQTGTIIVKGFETMGAVTIGSDNLLIRSKESVEIKNGKKVHGLSIGLGTASWFHDRVLIDYEEIDGLLNAVDYLNKITYDVTLLSGFEGTYTTKAGLQIIAHSIRREGNIQAFIQYGDHPRIALSSIQMKQLYEAVERAKKYLDSLREAK